MVVGRPPQATFVWNDRPMRKVTIHHRDIPH
jgi:hypothetical protein